MSSTTMMPRISRLSGLASRRSSTRSLVTIADDEMPTAPATTRASPVPRTSANPNASPPPTLSSQVDRPGREELVPAAHEVVEREFEAEVEQQQHEAEGGQQLEVFGLLHEDYP